jgi:hypothetical protein
MIPVYLTNDKSVPIALTHLKILLAENCVGLYFVGQYPQSTGTN